MRRASVLGLLAGLATTLVLACGGRSFVEEEAPSDGGVSDGSGAASGAGGPGLGAGGAATAGCLASAKPGACLVNCRPPPEVVLPDCVNGEWRCPAPARPISECPIGTCPDSRVMCCNPAIGEAYFPSCDTTWVYRTCPSGAIMLEGGSCEVVPDFACPPTNAEVNASSCELPGAVCDYYLGCGLTRRCKCEAPLPRSPSGASPTWVCTSADCAR